MACHRRRSATAAPVLPDAESRAVLPAAVPADQGAARRAASSRGEWRPGEAIPSEIDLARRFGVSQGTVRKAIDALSADNLVVRRQGKGTFVATHTEEKASNFRFLRIRRCDGEDEHPASRLIDVRRARAGAEVARRLELKAGDAVIVLRRVLEYAGEPVLFDEITLPAALFRGLTKASSTPITARCTASSRRNSASGCCGRGRS